MPNALLQTINASWETGYSEAVWQRIEQRSVRAAAGFRYLGPAVPDSEEPRLAQVAVRAYSEGGGEPALLQWSLVVRGAPSGAPPEDIVERDKTLGGRRGLMQLLADSFSRPTPQVGFFRIKLRLDASRYSCPLLPMELRPGGPHDPALALASKATMEQVGYRFEDGVSGIREVTIIYLHEENVLSVTILAKGHLKLCSTTWLPYADEIAELVSSAFFQVKEDVP